jgi:hypothetical protein
VSGHTGRGNANGSTEKIIMMLIRTDLPRRLIQAALALLVTLGAGLSAHAQGISITGGGLYDFLIQTNCFAVSAQANTRTPSWISDGTYPGNRVPLLATGTAKGIIRTIDLPDQVSFISSNPAVIPPPPKIQAVGAIGGVKYQPTDVYFTIKSPSRPTDVDITAVGPTKSIVGAVVDLGQPKLVKRKLRVYPPQKISKATIGSAKAAPYSAGNQLRIDVTLPWKIPFSTTTVVVGKPLYQNRGGYTVSLNLPEWKDGSHHQPKMIDVPPNTNKVSFDFVAQFPSDAAVESLGQLAFKTSLVVPVQLKTRVPSCAGLVIDPSSVEVRYTMQKRRVLAPKDPLPSKPDAEPEKPPKPRPRIRQ